MSLYVEPYAYIRFEGEDWRFHFRTAAGDVTGGPYATESEALEAAYEARNEQLSRCPMCGGTFEGH
jgi:hypothetical protein